MLQISKAAPKPKNNNDSACLRAMVLSLKQNARKIQAVDAASLKVFKVRLDGALSNPIWWKVSLPMPEGLEFDDL